MNTYFKNYQYNYKDISARGNKSYGRIYALMEIDKKY